MECRLYHTKNMRNYPIAMITHTCTADGHITCCAGLRHNCDKDERPCRHVVMQGPEPFCRQAREVRDCHGDQDFCDLPESEQANNLSREREAACRL